mmetsp:Transcript_2486/g.5838  ORF Transcript_2486/g.5838 Transcript_2486/m.5838 type:complete len:248 (+) Transcript_2486:50-793(+)
MGARTARSRLPPVILLGSACWWSFARDFVFPGPAVRCRVALRAQDVVDAEVVQPESTLTLAQVEASLEEQIAQAQASDNPNRLRDLARLLVMAKTAEGIAAAELATDASDGLQTAMAGALSDFVGKEDYEIEDVVEEVNKRVKALDSIYIEDIQREVSFAGQAAVASFTGKEDYEFGDITKEVATRAKDAVTSFTGKDEYQFGDITKEALKRGGDAIKDFTGKEEYKFGDITKTLFKNVFGGSDEKK